MKYFPSSDVIKQCTVTRKFEVGGTVARKIWSKRISKKYTKRTKLTLFNEIFPL